MVNSNATDYISCVILVEVALLFSSFNYAVLVITYAIIEQ